MLPYAFQYYSSNLRNWSTVSAMSGTPGSAGQCIVTGNTINLTPFKTLTLKSNFYSPLDRQSFSFYIINDTYTRADKLSYSLKSLKYVDLLSNAAPSIDISSINQHVYFLITYSEYEKDSQSNSSYANVTEIILK